MTTLTEQWKNGDLPEETECYVRVDGDIYLGSIQYKNGCHNKKLPYVKSFNGQFITKRVEEILAEVPTFEQWQELNKRLSDTQKLELEVRRENTKLKELLKECREVINWQTENYDEKPLVSKIDQVLADNKMQANTIACNKIQENK